MSDEHIAEFVRAARRFAEQEVAPTVGTEGRDGDLEALPALFERARSIGLVSSPDTDAPGHELGIWGSASLRDGPEASLRLLEEVSVACAGVACCMHAAGLGALELEGLESPDLRVPAVAFLDDAWRPDWAAVRAPPANALRLSVVGTEISLSGEVAFVLAPPDCDGVVAFAARDDVWNRVVVPLTEATTVEDMGQRCGLAALRVLRVHWKNVRLPGHRVLAQAQPHATLQRLSLGLAALALGNARGALLAARRYASERYQGGSKIECHPAVQRLLGDSASRVVASAAHLRSTARVRGSEKAMTWNALAAKLRVTTECCEAVSDCLQVLGGYGYMEDYRLEKRLRDALALKTMTLRPDDLRLMCADEQGAVW